MSENHPALHAGGCVGLITLLHEGDCLQCHAIVSYCAHSSHATDSNTPEGKILLAGSLCSLIPFAGMAAIGSKAGLNMLGCMS